MSYDLEVATHLRPVEDALSQFADANGLIAEGALLGDAGNLVVYRPTARGVPTPFTVDGPFAVEPEDLDEALLAVVLRPLWVTQLSVTAGASKTVLASAHRAARFLADEYQGAVFDPQDGRVVWPRGLKPRYRPPSPEARISLIKFEWFFAPERLEGLSSGFLRVVRRRFPEALPVRFGTYEPFQHRLDTEGLEGFERAWREESERERPNAIYWTARAPVFAGSIGFPDRVDADVRFPGGRPVSDLELDIDGRALLDARWRELAVDLFVSIANELGALYAAGVVERDVIARRGRLWYSQESEGIFVGRHWWQGLPAIQAWLTWFGSPYRDVVASAIEDRAERIGQGLFMRIGDEPQHRGQLQDVYPRLPVAYVASFDHEEDPSEYWGYLITADVIPPLC